MGRPGLRFCENGSYINYLAVGINDGIWSTMLATGLDQVFTFIEDTTTALTSLIVGE